MPKTKTNSSSKKRFKITGSGKIMCKHSYMRHNQRKKTKKQKRALGASTLVSKADTPRVLALLS